MSLSIEDFIYGIPKVELHLHIEGTFEPELMFEIAKRNKIEIPYNSVEEVKAAYHFNNLQEFLDIYYAGAGVLIEMKDFYDLTWAYLEDLAKQNVVHTEIFFDPQTHTERGIAIDTVMKGITRALEDGKNELGISSKLIMCFLRHLDEASAIKTLEEAVPYKNKIIGVGLDSSEQGNPPSKFARVFAMAKERGFLTVAHAGEEGPAEYVWEAIDLLEVDRVDHGNNALCDDNLVDELIERQIPLTVCPLSNLKLQVVKDLSKHSLKTMLDRGLLATINSDDPAYFGGNLTQNLLETTAALNLSKEDITLLSKNGIKASFLEPSRKEVLLEKVEAFYKEYR